MISPVAIPFTSPLYPLPEDYPTLTTEGARLARTNACRQWLVPSADPDDRGYRRACSVNFFDRYYLWPSPDEGYDPGFYDDPPLDTPEMHFAILSLFGSSNLSVAVAPRGGAKSTLNRKDALTLLVSRPSYSLVYATSSIDNAKMSGTIIRDQLYENPRVHDDFCPDYGVDRFKPTRGDRPTGVEFFYTAHNGWVRCISAQSKMRGLRPKKFKLDDPEYDESASTSMQVIRDYMARLLFKLALPMVLRAGSSLDWTATHVSKRHYSWAAMKTITGPSGVLTAQDPRFNYWSRLLVKAAITDPSTGALVSCWPAMWPETVAKRISMGITDPISLPEIEARMGKAAFRSEMLGEPGEGEDSYFKLDDSPTGPHAWWLEGHDESTLLYPWDSQATICWLRDGATRRMALGAFLRNYSTFQTVDTAYTENSTSDRRACTTMALTEHNELFVLDMWSDRKGDNVLLRRSFEMAARWHTPVIHIEVVRESFKLYQRYCSTIATGAIQAMGFSHVPAVRKLKPGTTSKTDKISTLDTRFEQSTIKVPLFRLTKGLWWGRLKDQIEGFNPDAMDGGLEKDDELDTVAMSLFIVKGKNRRRLRDPKPPVTNPLDAISKGQLTIPGTDVPLALGVPLELMDAATLCNVMAATSRSTAKSERTTRV